MILSLRSLLRVAFPAAVALSIYSLDASAQTTSPGESSNTGAQPGLTNNQGSNSQTQQPGSSQTGTQSGAVNPSGNQPTGVGSQSAGTGTSPSTNPGTGNSSSGSGGTSGAGGITIPRPAEGLPGTGRATSGSSATSPAAGSPATGSTTAAGPAGAAANMASNDQQLAQCLIVDNEGEVAVSELGIQQAQSPAVKQFAERMVKDHNDMLGKLHPLMAQASGRSATYPDSNVLPQSTTIPDSPAAQTGRTDAVAANAGGISGGGASAAAGANGLDFVAIKRELGAQSLASKKAELQGKHGAEFDTYFMGIQVAMHMDAVDTLKVFQKHATGELRKAIDEALPITQAHLEHAKETIKSLDTATAAAPKAP
jgi:predicted outer membrane protein